MHKSHKLFSLIHYPFTVHKYHAYKFKLHTSCMKHLWIGCFASRWELSQVMDETHESVGFVAPFAEKNISYYILTSVIPWRSRVKQKNSVDNLAANGNMSDSNAVRRIPSPYTFLPPKLSESLPPRKFVRT